MEELVDGEVVVGPSSGQPSEVSVSAETNSSSSSNVETSNGEPNATISAKEGFEALDPDVQRLFVEGMAKHNLKSSDVDPVVFSSLSEFGVAAQREIASRYVGENLSTVNNKSGYLIGIMKKFRERRDRRSPDRFGADERGAPIPKLPPPKNSTPVDVNPDGGIKLLDPELKETLSKSLAKFDIQADAIDPCIFESFVTFPMSMQKDMVRMLAQENLSKIHNISGYIVGMLVKFRKRFVNNQQASRRSRSRSPRRHSRGRSPRRHSRGRSPPRFHRARSPHRDRGRSPYSSRHGSPYRDRDYGGRRSPSRYDHHYYRRSRSPSPRYRSPARSSSYGYSSSASHRSPPRRSPPRRSSPRRASPPRYEDRSGYQPSLDARPYASESRSYREPPASAEVIPAALRHSWFFADRNQGVKNGPFPAEEIKREWNRGLMNSSWLAWHSGMDNWQEVRTLPNLLHYLTGAQDINGGILR